MARSLTITPEESASTSSLLTGFLLLSVVWLAFSGLGLGSADAADAAPGGAPQTAEGAGSQTPL